MKKKSLIILMICIFLLSGSQVYASDYEIAPCFNVVSAANTVISSENDGIDLDVFVTIADSSMLDRVYITVKVKKTSTGATVKTYAQNMEDQGSVFRFSETYEATSSGTYLFEYTAKCYKNNVLVDTVTGNSASVYHTV